MATRVVLDVQRATARASERERERERARASNDDMAKKTEALTYWEKYFFPIC